MGEIPCIRKACFLITIDNGGLNRFRTEKQVKREMERFLESRPYIDHFAEINAWLSSLSDEDMETACCGENTEMEAIMAGAPAFTEMLLSEYFDEVC